MFQSRLPFYRPPVDLTVFLLPPLMRGQPYYLTGVFTQQGMAKALRNPQAFQIGMEQLRETYKTPIELIRGPRMLFLDGHECPPCTYEVAIEVAEEFRRTIEHCLSFEHCVVAIPEEHVIMLRVA